MNKTSAAEADMAKADKKGFKTNINIIHPVTKINSCVGNNYVLMEYGTGAIMAFQHMMKEILSLQQSMKFLSQE